MFSELKTAVAYETVILLESIQDLPLRLSPERDMLLILGIAGIHSSECPLTRFTVSAKDTQGRSDTYIEISSVTFSPEFAPLCPVNLIP